jgi:protein-L-isoaspartate(D-aspartate) O-methyltransferase
MSARILIQMGVCVVAASIFVDTTHSWAQEKAAGRVPGKSLNPQVDPTAPARNRMVQRHLVERGLKNPRVLEAFRTVPRHLFLPPKTQRQAYDDESIPIGEGQTITPPYDVAFMTEVLDPKPTDRVYEVGTGSGYQSAILSRLVKDVYSVEIHEPLSKRATQVHKDLGYTNIHTRVGDGYVGWPEAAPFDSIIVTCAPTKVPQPLFDQLKEGGRMVIPIGDRFHQIVHLIIKKDGKRVDSELKPTLFVPMTGRDQEEAAAARRGGEGTKTATPKERPQDR